MQINIIERVFTFNGMTLDDINSNLSTDQIKQHYSGLYPELTNADTINKGLTAEGKHLYEFMTILGTKG